MDIPSANFYLENKKIFPFQLLSGIQSKMPVPSEFQGVPVTGQEIDTDCFFEVEVVRQGCNVFPEAKPDFIFGQGEHFSPRKGICGNFNSFSDLSISQLVGGFVGSKSQIRSANREAYQVWDVIFRQLAETAYQPLKVQNNPHSQGNFSKAFPQNLFNSFYQGSKSSLGGIASLLISSNCEHRGGNEFVQTKSQHTSKEVGPPPVGDSEVISRTLNFDPLLTSDPSMRNSELGPKSASSKQSYAEVAKASALCKPDGPSSGRSTVHQPLPSQFSSKNSPKQIKMNNSKHYLEGWEMSYGYSSEKYNWRERNDSAHSVYQKPPVIGWQSKQSKKFGEVYPAFNCKNHSKSPEGKTLERFSKHYPKNFKHVSGDVKSSNSSEREGARHHAEVSPFGRTFKIVSKDFLSRTKEFRKSKKYVERRNVHFFNLKVNSGNFCRNWRCKHNGVVCGDTPDCETVCSKTSVMLPRNDDLSTGVDGQNSPGNDSSADRMLEESSSTDCLSVSGSCLDLSDVRNDRNRFLSECSVDSDDSFVVMFESDNVPGDSCGVRMLNRYPSCDSDASDSWSDDDSDDDCFQEDNSQTLLDEIDCCFFSPPLIVSGENCSSNDRLRNINKKWKDETANLPSVEKSPEKVHFADSDNLATVHVMVTWDFAYRAARCGPWEEMARDRARFQARIDRSESVLAPILAPEHRCRVQQRMEPSAIR